jgi:hypothetical protein
MRESQGWTEGTGGEGINIPQVQDIWSNLQLEVKERCISKAY